MHYLTFNPTCARHKTLPSDGTCSSLTSYYLVKMVKPKSTVIYSWQLKTTHSSFAIFANFSKTAYCISAKTRLISFKKCFNHSSGFNSPPLYLDIFLSSDPTLSRGRGVGWIHLVCISSQLWLDSIHSQLIFQLTVMSSSQMTSPSFFLSWLNLLPVNF